MEDIDSITLIMWAFSKLQKENENLKKTLTETKVFSEMKSSLLEKRNENLLLKIKLLEEEIDNLKTVIKNREEEHYYDQNNQETFQEEMDIDLYRPERMDIDTEMDIFSDSDDN